MIFIHEVSDRTLAGDLSYRCALELAVAQRIFFMLSTRCTLELAAASPEDLSHQKYSS